MLSHPDFLEATRRFKDKRTKPHARTRYHALLLVSKGYTYQQTADILFVDPESVSRWVVRYEETGLDGLQNHPRWGGEHGQRRLSARPLARLGTLLDTEAMPGTEVGSGWTLRAVIALVEERFAVSYSQRGMRKVLRRLSFSLQRGRPFTTGGQLASRPDSSARRTKSWPSAPSPAHRSCLWRATRREFTSKGQSASGGVGGALNRW